MKSKESTIWHRKMISVAVKSLLLFDLFTFIPLNANAQVKLGIKGGLDVSEMSFSGDVFKKSNRMGYFIGPVLKFPLLGLGFDISALYAKRNVELNGSIEGEKGKYKVSDKQILIPVHVRYGLNFNGGGIFAFAGPQFGFTLDNDEDKELIDNVASWRSRDSDISFDLGGGITLGHLELTVNYNVPLGKAGEVHINDAANQVFTKGTYKTWKISAAYFF